VGQQAAADAGFQGRAQAQVWRSCLEGRQQGPGVAFAGRTAHLPAAPALGQGRIGQQGFIQGHRHQGGQPLQALRVRYRERLLQPVEPRISGQAFSPGLGGGSVPAFTRRLWIGLLPTSAGEHFH